MNRRAIHLYVAGAVIVLIAASILANPPAGGIDGRSLLAFIVALYVIFQQARTA